MTKKKNTIAPAFKKFIVFIAAALFILFLFLVLPDYWLHKGIIKNMSENGSVAGDEYTESRIKMVENQLKSRDITDERVLKAMEKVPRHIFMPHSWDMAYNDHPVPIGFSQTISQPYIVALMAQELKLEGNEIVLEIGAGSGYNAAVLAELSKEVYTIEIIEELAEWSKKSLEKAGYKKVHVMHADGYYGWEGKEFNAIILTAAANHVPLPLIDQLKTGGRLIMPLSSPAGFQTLNLLTKTSYGLDTKVITGVRFVPMTGKAQK